MKLEKFLQEKYGYNPEIKDNIKSYIDLWKQCYEGDIKKFHHYFIYNGKKKIPQKRFTMNMPKEISEDWGDIIWSEKCKISMKNDDSQKEFDNLIDELDLNTFINSAIEKSGALGTESAVVGVYDIIQNEDSMILDVSNAKTRIDLVDVDWIFPLSWNTSKGIYECAFGSVQYIKGQKYVVLSVHKIADDGNYHIYNHLFRDSNGNLSEITQDNTILDFNTQSNVKWFSIFKPLLTNNLFSNSPFGIPHYANSIDKIKAVDIDFDGFKNEVLDGRKRTFARADMFNYDDGEQKMVFDPNDTTIYQLPDGANKDDLIQSDSDALRITELVNALNTSLNVLGSSVGFGENHYHFDGTNLSTATAVISSNSKMFRRLKKLQIGYESSIFDLVNAICYASTQFGPYNINTEDMAIKFDDSIVEDKEVESNRALRELSAGVLSKIEYRTKIYGETEQIARKKILEIQEETKEIEEILNPEEEQNEDENASNLVSNLKNKNNNKE